MFNWIAQTLAVTGLNLRTIPRRLGSTAVAIIGIAGVVVVFVSVLSIAAGFTAAMRGSGSASRAIVMRSGADSEMTSGLSGTEVDVIKQAPGTRRNGQAPLASAELFVIIDFPKKSTNTSANVCPVRPGRHRVRLRHRAPRHARDRARRRHPAPVHRQGRAVPVRRRRQRRAARHRGRRSRSGAGSTGPRSCRASGLPMAGQVPPICSMGGLGTFFQRRLVPTLAMISGPWSLYAPSFKASAIDFGRMRIAAAGGR